MRHAIRVCLVLLALWLGYVVVRALVRAVRRSMGLPVSEPSEEQRLLRQAIIGTLASTIVPLAYLRHDAYQAGAILLVLMAPAFFGAGVLWLSGARGILGLYRREPRLLLHPTVFITCVAAAFSFGMAALVLLALLRRALG